MEKFTIQIPYVYVVLVMNEDSPRMSQSAFSTEELAREQIGFQLREIARTGEIDFEEVETLLEWSKDDDELTAGNYRILLYKLPLNEFTGI